MKIVKKVLSIIGDVIVGLILLLSVMIVISTITSNKTGVPSAFGIVTYTVPTDSMNTDPSDPESFAAGDLIIGVVPKDDYEYKVGDIVTYKGYLDSYEVLYTHRIVEIDEEGNYITRGDNHEICTDNDAGYRTKESIVAIYKFKVKNLGKVIDFIKDKENPMGFILCILLPMLIFIGIQVYRIIKIYVENKKAEMIDSVKENASDDVKEAIIREYLEKQKALENSNKEENKNE